ncbi:MAG: response regulator transcription factor [Planctomycetia bacterium]|nr:response regulator transcription factor [Planctomycetia bacterium]
MTVRLLIADDHEVVRHGLANLLSGTDVEIVAEAATPADAVRMAKKHKPDVALLDIRMVDGGDGLAALEKIHRELPETKVVMLSAFDNPTYVARAHALGASDYLLKGCSRDQLLDTIHAVATQPGPSAHGELHKVAGTMATRQKSDVDETSLTQRETQVLRHLALGLSNKEIAKSLSISVETVKEHVQHVLRKIGVNDRTQAAVWAVRKGIV